MSQSAVNFRMDAGLKQDFANVCDQLGLSVSGAFTVFAKAVVRENAIPFRVTTATSSSRDLAELRAALIRLDHGEGVRKTVAELDAMAG